MNGASENKEVFDLRFSLQKDTSKKALVAYFATKKKKRKSEKTSSETPEEYLKRMDAPFSETGATVSTKVSTKVSIKVSTNSTKVSPFLSHQQPLKNRKLQKPNITVLGTRVVSI